MNQPVVNNLFIGFVIDPFTLCDSLLCQGRPPDTAVTLYCQETSMAPLPLFPPAPAVTFVRKGS